MNTVHSANNPLNVHSVDHSVNGFQNVVEFMSKINEFVYFPWKLDGMWYDGPADDPCYYVESITLHVESKSKTFNFNFSCSCLARLDHEELDELNALWKKRNKKVMLAILLVNSKTHWITISSISIKSTPEVLVTSWVTKDGQKHRFIRKAPTAEETKIISDELLKEKDPLMDLQYGS